MSVTRREFILRTVGAGGALMVYPSCARGNDTHAHGKMTGYAQLEAEGKLAERVEEALGLFDNCRLCPRLCGVNRARGQIGYCRAPRDAVVSSHQPHFGEELPLTGQRGSGTVFFANCNLRCVFCQNWPIAHEGRGRQVSDEDVADRMMALQRRGCHNINVVTPTHVMPNILAATRIALKKGLRLPLVYNTGGYERPEMIQRLEGIVDIYMPDLKFMDAEHARDYVGAADYPEMAKASIQEMFRQVGPLQLDRNGIATHGLMIRHLVMPNRVSNARAFVQWVADTLSTDVYVNLMPQYRVEYRAYEHPKIARAITADEFYEALDWAENAGLTHLDKRSSSRRALFRRLGG